MKSVSKVTVRALCAFFAASILLFSLFSVALYAIELDYSRPGYTEEDYNEELDSVFVIEELFGLTLGETEKSYLEDSGSFTLSYPKNVPSSYVDLRVIGKILVVSAKPYTYVSSGGTTVSWFPVSVTPVAEGYSKALFPDTPDGSGYYNTSYSFDTVPETFELDLEYRAKLTIPKDVANAVLTDAYSDAKYFIYLEELEEYRKELLVYEEYLARKLEYDAQRDEYLLYLEDLQDFEIARTAYEKYLIDKEKYNADYLAYLKNLKEAEKLADEIAAYNEYVAKMDRINYRLSLFEDLKLKITPLERSVWGAIKGNIVDQVIAEEDLLAGNVIGADREAVRSAGDATIELRKIFDGYFSLETDALKYRYYQVNYQSFKTNVIKLFAALENLYENETVRGIIAAKERTDKYEILLAQLYLVANAVSDGPVYSFDGSFVFDGNYKFACVSGDKTAYEILATDTYFVDRNIATPPADESYPTPVAKPDYTPIPEPIAPTPVKEPTAPTPVKEPIPPSAVAEPLLPNEVVNSGVNYAPPYAQGSVPAKLIEAYREGKLDARENKLADKDVSFYVYVNVSKMLGAEEVTVTYHDANMIPVDDVKVDAGSFAEIPYIPTKPDSESGQFTYTFEKWVDEYGNPVSLKSVNSDMRIYPSFKESVRLYDVSFALGGNVYTQKLPYGSIPEYPGTPSLSGSLDKYYVFVGWQEPIVPVTQNAVYTAVFEEKKTVPELPDGSIVKLSDTLVGVSAPIGTRLDITKLLELSAGKYALSFKLSRNDNTALPCAEINVSYADVLNMKSIGASYIEFWFSDAETSSEYLVNLFGSNGETLENSIKMNALVSTPHTAETMRLVYYDETLKTYVRYSLNEGKLAFNLNTGRAYRYILEYSVSLFKQDDVSVTLDKTIASPGDAVLVGALANPGIKLTGVFYVKDGVKTYIENGSFIMPAASVVVGADYERIVYYVSFVSDGMVVQRGEYYYGDTLTVPDGVEKAGDGEYEYTFKSWTPTVVETVTANASYTAVYDKTPIEKKDDGGIKISDGTMRIIMTAGIVGFFTVFALIPSLVLSLVLMIKRSRRGTKLFGKTKSR